MRRSGEGQIDALTSPRPSPFKGEGDTSSRVDAFSRAIVDEKNVAVRGYLENLRSQIAAIAARHGANARDVWNKEVQDRMSVDEMERVNALFLRIRRMAEKKLSPADTREIGRELGERMAAAREMLQEAQSLSNALTGKNGNDTEIAFVRSYLRAGMYMDAVVYCEDMRGKCPASLHARASLGRAREVRHDDSTEFGDEMITAWQRIDDGMFRESKDFFEDVRIFSDFFKLRLETQADLLPVREMDRVTANGKRLLPIALPILLAEMKRRGMRPGVQQEVLGRAAKQFVDDLPPGRYFRYRLFEAETLQASGEDPKALLRDLIGYARGCAIGDGVNAIEEIARVAGKLGAFDVVDEILAQDWWKKDVTREEPPDVPVSAALGCVEGGLFDRAIAYLPLMRPTNRFYVGIDLSRALLDVGEIDRAERVRAELVDKNTLWLFRESDEYLAARARRGDDILGEAKRIADHRAIRDDGASKPKTLASAAIATIGYTVEMKKRIEEYASKR